MWDHVRHDTDEYEERNLGEIAAENQIYQDQYQSPHIALSDRIPGQDNTPYTVPVHARNFTPQSPIYEPVQYSNDYHISAYDASVPYGCFGRPDQPDERAQPSTPYPNRDTAARSAEGSANLFNVRAEHHLPGSHTASNMSAYQDRVHTSSTQFGDPLPGFPNWSRTWYDGYLSADGHAYTNVPPPSGQSGWESESYGRISQAFAPYAGARTTDHVKEERIRMLEQEFEPQITHGEDEAEDEESRRKGTAVGSIDADGRLVLPARKLTNLVRGLQCLLSLTAAGCGIGGFILIHPTAKAPPAGTMPAFVIYGAAAVSTLVCLWLFVLKPCCVGSRQRDVFTAMGGGASGMVIPVVTGGKAGKGKKGKQAQSQGTYVNVILNPAMFLHDPTGSASNSDDDAKDTRRYNKWKSKEHRRRDFLAKSRAEEQWRVARKALKWDCLWDVLLCLLWTATAVFVLGFGKSCPAGSAQGWCDLYNGAIACAVMAVIACTAGIYCDIVRLRVSRSAP